VNDRRIGETLKLVGLGDRMHSKVKTFSHGMKQRLGIAQALLHEPELLILDEPDSGLDPKGIRDIRELIRFLNRERNMTIFISSHKLFEIEQIANRMIIIDQGKALVEGNVADLLASRDKRIYPEQSLEEFYINKTWKSHAGED
jgi:ABC-2 type transport system ATP-binding protein